MKNNGLPPANARLLNDKNFWSSSWTTLNRNDEGPSVQENIDQVCFWNDLAEILEKNSQKKRTRQRVAGTLHFLSSNQVQLDGLKVLDIGAGVGDFSIAFANKGAAVTALEPAEKNLEIMRCKVNRAKVNNIVYLARRWEELDPAAEKLEGAFDLVFASLVPVLRNPESLFKIISLSRSWCLLCDIAAGSAVSPGRSALWQILFNEAMPSGKYNIIYPLNYLYLSGYPLAFQTWSEKWDEELTIEEAIRYYTNYFSLYLEPEKEMIDKISNYITSRAVNGIYRDEHEVRLGMILWRTVAFNRLNRACPSDHL